MYFDIEYCNRNATENAPFKIERENGMNRHLFFYFSSQVIIKIYDEIIECPPGTCILYEPTMYQYFYVEKNRLNHDYIDFTLNEPNFFKEINFPVNRPFNLKNTDNISKTIAEIVDEKNGVEIGNKYKCELLLMKLFIDISRAYHHRKTYSNEKFIEVQREKFEQMRLNMYKSPDQIKVSSLAKQMGYSLARFTELYKKYFGCSPIEDLTKARILRVKLLLEEGTKTKEIIKLLGFSGEEYFYRWFKKNFKMTINEYKDKNLKQQ